jgi:hypothetical protein
MPRARLGPECPERRSAGATARSPGVAVATSWWSGTRRRIYAALTKREPRSCEMTTPRLPPRTSSTSDGCPSANACIVERMQKSCLGVVHADTRFHAATRTSPELDERSALRGKGNRRGGSVSRLFASSWGSGNLMPATTRLLQLGARAGYDVRGALARWPGCLAGRDGRCDTSAGRQSVLPHAQGRRWAPLGWSWVVVTTLSEIPTTAARSGPRRERRRRSGQSPGCLYRAGTCRAGRWCSCRSWC